MFRLSCFRLDLLDTLFLSERDVIDACTVINRMQSSLRRSLCKNSYSMKLSKSAPLTSFLELVSSSFIRKAPANLSSAFVIYSSNFH